MLVGIISLRLLRWLTSGKNCLNGLCGDPIENEFIEVEYGELTQPHPSGSKAQSNITFLPAYTLTSRPSEPTDRQRMPYILPSTQS